MQMKPLIKIPCLIIKTTNRIDDSEAKLFITTVKERINQGGDGVMMLNEIDSGNGRHLFGGILTLDWSHGIYRLMKPLLWSVDLAVN